MSQDTRKDKRARDINVVVRYKSATVDEFIENHSFDISRGGAFIKTANPFPPGTLLKFELRLAADEKMISGVGRVVWKREAAQATAQNPSGMGVKFIKIDDASKAVIDSLVAQNPAAGGAFEAVAPVEGSSPPPAQGKPALASPQKPSRTIAGMPTPLPELQAKDSADSWSLEEMPAADAKPPLQAPARATFSSRKATMMGIGVGSTPPPKPGASVPPPAAAPAAPAAPGARPEPTVMKQAAELLAEALKEAGGSMDEIEGNPLLDHVSQQQKDDLDAAAAKVASEAPMPPSSKSKGPDVPRLVPSDPPGGDEEIPTRVVASSELGSKGMTTPMPVRPASEPPAPVVPKAPPTPAVAAAKPVQSAPRSPEKKGGSGAIIAIAVLLLLGAGAGYAWKSGLLGGGGGQVVPSNVPNVTVPIETASAVPTATAAPQLSATTSAAPSASASASAPTPSATGAASAAPTATATVKVVPPPAPPGVPQAPPPKAPPKAPEGDPAPAPAPTAAAPKATATAAPAATPAPAPAPVAPPDDLK